MSLRLISELAGQLDNAEGREGLQTNAGEVARRAAGRLSEEEERL